MRCGSGVWRDPIEKWTSCDRESSSALRLPARWPWQTEFIEALTRIRALPAAA